MRYYDISITNPDTKAIVKRYTSLTNSGGVNGSALRVDFDIPAYSFASPAGGGIISIHGIDYKDIQEAANLNNMTVTLSGGMSKGLPLASPAQAGILTTGIILQAFGNWQGPAISLDLIIAPVSSGVKNLTGTWARGSSLQACVTQVLGQAFPGSSTTGGFSGDLVYPQDVPFVYSTLEAFAAYVNRVSLTINNAAGYGGAHIVKTQDGFRLYDSDSDSGASPVTISPLDLIGQPTWLNPGQISLKTVLRADLGVGQPITLPAKINAQNTAQSWSASRAALNFSNGFTISRLRHLGSSRQSSAESWCTIIEATVKTS